MTSSGAYIAFEGIDGAGKSTQAELLARRLDAVLTCEPGGTDLGQLIRPLLLGKDTETPTENAEALLFAADRAQHLGAVVAPALAAGRHVVSDRSYGSTLAYQGYGRQASVERIWELVVWSSQVGGVGLDAAAVASGETAVASGEKCLLPDLVVLLKLPEDEALERVAAARVASGPDRPKPDRIEDESAAFIARVNEGFSQLARKDKRRWVSVDAVGGPEEVEQAVLGAVSDHLARLINDLNPEEGKQAVPDAVWMGSVAALLEAHSAVRLGAEPDSVALGLSS